MPRGSQVLTKSAQGSQKATTKAVFEGCWAPREALGRVWNVSGTPQGTILEPNLIPNLMILLQTSSKPFFSMFLLLKFVFFGFC